MTWFHALGSLAHKRVIKVPLAGLCLFLPSPLSGSREVILFGPTLAVLSCHLCTPLGAVEVWVCSPCKGCDVQIPPRCAVWTLCILTCTYDCSFSLESVPGGYSRVRTKGWQLFIPLLTCACCSCPALSFPELPSLVPFQGLAGPWESALPVSVGMWWWWRWCFKGRKNREALRGVKAELPGWVNS